MGILQKGFEQIVRWCLHISEAPQKDLKVLVVNRVQKIQEYSDVNQWNYVKGRGNPADQASRGLDLRKETSSSNGSLGLHSYGKENFG